MDDADDERKSHLNVDGCYYAIWALGHLDVDEDYEL